MKEAFTAMALSKDSLALIVHMRRIVDAYLNQGLTLTLRQLYYRLVAADLIPNTERSYKRAGRILSDARMCGMIDWNAIEDRERGVITIRNEIDRHVDHDVFERVREREGVDRRRMDRVVERWDTL